LTRLLPGFLLIDWRYDSLASQDRVGCHRVLFNMTRGKSPKSAPRHNKAVWDYMRPFIEQKYKKQPLPQVMAAMKKEHGFSAR